MASRGSPGGLESISSASLHKVHDVFATHPPLKKRKTYHTVEGHLAAQPISIRAHAASLSDEPYVLEPIAVIPRSRLLFSWLDSPSALSQIQPGSLFIANIPILENDEPNVLAVRLISDGALYLIERAKKGIYALSKLARGVDEGDIVVAVNGWSPATATGGKTRWESPVDGDWWQTAQIDDPIIDIGISAKRANFDVSVVFGMAGVKADDDVCIKDDVLPMHSMESRGQSLAPHVVPMERSSSFDVHMPSALHDFHINSDAAVFGDVGTGGDHGMVDSLQSPEELLDLLREQYLMTLYISKTSVAYFAKGPLARCRAAFQPCESTTTKAQTDLIEFYREAIMAAKKMDLKYRETLPATIRDVLLSVSDDEVLHSKKRKSGKKKKKLGKNGLYPEEEGFIRRWWKDRALTEPGVPVETLPEVELKKHVADLRLRETQLQILLILETLALEAEAKKANDGDKASSHETAKGSKQKKAQDPNVMLELHLDRLCIWHAVSFDDTAISDPPKSFDSLSGKKVESDAVRDFCTEVIIPFYASRLPDRCKLITRKLGVSGAMTPLKQSQTKKVPRGEPGAVVERQPSQRHPRRTLQRVLTDEQTVSKERHVSLGHSNTVSSQSELRRESMEPLLPGLSSNVRGGIQKAKRAQNREVDLNAVARQHETKLKRVQMLVEQKKELDAAILALRKPNRELVAKDIAEDAEKRTTGSVSSRKPKNPVRNPFGQGVQVMATPKGNRKKDAVVGLPPLPRGLVQSSSKRLGSSPFGNDPQVVPASTIRPSFFPSASSSRAVPFNPNQGDICAIQETPSRRPAQSQSLMDDAGLDGGSPSFSGNLFRVPRRPAPRSTDMAPSTPVAARHVAGSPISSKPMQTKSSVIMETPPRRGTVVHIIKESAPAASPAAGISTPVKNGAKMGVLPIAVPVTPEKSIYAHLGWDDDDELAL